MKTRRTVQMGAVPTPDFSTAGDTGETHGKWTVSGNTGERTVPPPRSTVPCENQDASNLSGRAPRVSQKRMQGVCRSYHILKMECILTKMWLYNYTFFCIHFSGTHYILTSVCRNWKPLRPHKFTVYFEILTLDDSRCLGKGSET